MSTESGRRTSHVGGATIVAGDRVDAVERLEVTGIVQGVGFRPFVHRLATELGIDGEVGNDSSRVFVLAAGPIDALDELARRIVDDAPPLARVDRLERRRLDVTASDRAGSGFRIVESRQTSGTRTSVPPDVAVCDDCVRELLDPTDRRYRHPFITCTNCGPRLTIITDLPYDRPVTTMARFEMCATCAAEYADPTDRRYHAQPIACHDCGPTLRLVAGRVTVHGDPTGERALARAIATIRAGGIVAVKGLGGYHLVCDATDRAAVRELRHRKQRPDKPFALMVRDLDTARSLVELDDVEADELISPARPILLARARPEPGVAPEVAPANPLLGVMLPYTPVHHLLFEALDVPLVMTSGNLAAEPLAYDDADAARRLGGLVDVLLTHDRPIEAPCDDSVVRIVDGVAIPIRRARGYAPVPVAVPPSDLDVLAVGGELKNTCCFASGDRAWVSQHVGDMENLETLVAFETMVDQYTSMYRIEPDVVAVDAHPGYATHRWARRHHPTRIVEVQHHHAHVAAVMAEHGVDLDATVIGVAFDGTGYGVDGAIWGGEFFDATAARAVRVAHLAEVPLPGGDAAVRHPCRVALSHLRAAGVAWDDDLAPVAQMPVAERELLARQLDRGVACVPTSSMGRLFDAVASLLGLRHHVSYEAHAAIELEVAASRAVGAPDPDYRFGRRGELGRDAAPVVRAIVDDLRRGVAVDEVAHGFHVAVAELVADVAAERRTAGTPPTVVLSGGVFQNAVLTPMCVRRLRADDFEVLTHRRVPPNDGGLALGQVHVARARARAVTDPIALQED